MQELIRLDIKWKKCKIPVGEFLCITGNTETGIIAAHRINFDAPYEISCLLSDFDNTKIYVNNLHQILSAIIYADRVVLKYFNNKKILTEKVYNI